MSRRSLMGTSRLGGVPTSLPLDAAPPAAATAMELFPRSTERAELSPGVVLISGWLSSAEQRALVDQFRVWALPPAGLRHPRVPSGHLMSVQSVCLGWHWQPYAYSRTADDTDGAPVKPLPSAIFRLARQAVAETFGASTAEHFEPDAVIANLYAGRGSASIRTPRSHRPRQSSPSAWATRACSASRASTAGPPVPRHPAAFGRSSGVWWPEPACTTESRRSSTTRDREARLPSGRLSLTVRETGFARVDAVHRMPRLWVHLGPRAAADARRAHPHRASRRRRAVRARRSHSRARERPVRGSTVRRAIGSRAAGFRPHGGAAPTRRARRSCRA
jgi:alkylated DNA repair protein (DNA oxidative demethylase)